jgi:hypothetical protein
MADADADALENVDAGDRPAEEVEWVDGAGAGTAAW